MVYCFSFIPELINLMVFNAKPGRSISLIGENIEIVDIVKYLGSTLSSSEKDS